MEQMKRNAIIDAIVKGDVKLLEALLTDEQPKFFSEFLHLALVHSIYYDQVDAKQFYPKEGRGIVYKCYMQKSFSEIVKLLLNRGADVNSSIPTSYYGQSSVFNYACRKANLNIVKLMPDYGPNLKVKNRSGYNAIETAFLLRDYDKINLFLDRGIKAEDIDRWDLLKLAAKHRVVSRREEIMRRLLQMGANVNICHGSTVLQYAMDIGDLKLVEFLIRKGADISKMREVVETPLICAVTLQQLDIVKCLLEQGADVNLGKKTYPLKAAVQTGNVKMVELLLNAGANVHVRENEGGTVIDVAAMEGHTEIVKLLLEYGAQLSNKYEAAFENALYAKNMDLMELLLQIDADVNRVFNGATILQRSIEMGELEIVDFLVKNGAIVNDFREEVEPPIIHAVAMQRLGIVKYLLEQGAYVDLGRETYSLQIAIRCGNYEIVKLLLGYGACIHGCKDEIDIALTRGYSEIVQLLLKRCPRLINISAALQNAIISQDVNIIEVLLKHAGYDTNILVQGRTTLYWAVEHRNKPMAQLLLDYGAPVNEKCDGYFPLYCAVRYEDFDMVALLLDHGADFNAKNINGNTALAASVEPWRYEMRRFLVKYVILKKSLGSLVSQENLDFMKESRTRYEFQINCERELELLRSEIFDNSNLSYFDVFQTKDLAALARNENIARVLKSNDFQDKFPTYGVMIIDLFNKGVLRNKDFELLKRFFNYLSSRDHDQLPKLPLTVSHEVFSYLRDRDFSNLRNC